MQPGPTASRAFRSTEELEILILVTHPDHRCLASAIERPRGHRAPRWIGITNENIKYLVPALVTVNMKTCTLLYKWERVWILQKSSPGRMYLHLTNISRRKVTLECCMKDATIVAKINTSEQMRNYFIFIFISLMSWWCTGLSYGNGKLGEHAMTISQSGKIQLALKRLLGGKKCC
jgi:hypothetical protein